VGCHFAGDGDWGTVTDVPWGVAYTEAIVGWPHPPGVRVHPTPIYEFVSSVVVFGILKALAKKNYAPGTIAWLYLILSGLARFVVEFWRINPAVAFGLTEAQLFSLALMVIGLAMLVTRSPRAVAATTQSR
jgi:phosphatidylglycerol---prolipoprotein diacylglyceryl transferase